MAVRTWIACALLAAACGHGHATDENAPARRIGPWRVPSGWRAETIRFPLGFAPTLAHQGVEELRFAPGMFDPKAPGYWSYAFVWRTDDPAELGADALGAELTTYFKGLIAAVDKDREIQKPEEITVRAQATTAGAFTLNAHVFDAFATGQPIDLVGTAARSPCGKGAVWTVVLAPAGAALREDLDILAAEARCGQPVARPAER